VTIPYPHELSGDVAHRLAASTLILKFMDEDKEKYGTLHASNPWNRSFVTGCLPDGSFAHVFKV
jgi:hypothetical protein